MLNNIIDKIKLPFRKEKELYLFLYKITGVIPHNIAYYKTAFLHKSLSRRNEKGKLINNERLEFLGDAVLDCVVADIVYERFPNKREGFLTNTRSKLVKRETLNQVAIKMGIDKMLKSNGHTVTHNCNLAGNAFEALVGALYLDYGYQACMHFMKDLVCGKYINIEKMAYREMNYKSKLIEWTQKNKVSVVFDEVKTSTDADGNPTFIAQVIIQGIRCEEGIGFTKKESQQNAAKLTYKRIRREAEFKEAILKERDKEEVVSVANTAENTANIGSEQPAEELPFASQANSSAIAEKEISEVTATELYPEGQENICGQSQSAVLEINAGGRV